MKRFFLCVLFLVLSSAAFGEVCNSGQFDMLTFMAPWQGVQNGHFDVLQPLSGTFYWVKGAQGFPWDVDTFDGSYVYQLDTEQVWSNPTTFKRFVHPLKWMPRCVNIPTAPGKVASITVSASDSDFEVHSSCTAFTVSNLGNIINELWWSAPTMTLSYRYSCDSSYSACKFKETFDLQQVNGLVKWTYYKWLNGAWAQQAQTVHGTATLGIVTPVHPCW